MLSPYPAYLMNAYPISEKIKDRHDLSVIQPTGRPVLYEGFGSISGDRVRKVKDYSNSPTMGEMAAMGRK